MNHFDSLLQRGAWLGSLISSIAAVVIALEAIDLNQVVTELNEKIIDIPDNITELL